MLAVLLAAGLLDAVTGGGPGPGLPRWYGLAFGTAAIAYRPLLGDPLAIAAGPGPVPERIARFALPRGAALLVTERRGAVAGIEVRVERVPSGVLLDVEADPSGVTLGSRYEDVAAQRPTARRASGADGERMLVETLDSARGLAARYTFRDDRLVDDAWSTPPATDGVPPAGGIAYSEPAGDDPTTAVLDVQTNARDGRAWERAYLAGHPCGEAEPWLVTGTSTRRVRERWYDVVAVRCPGSGAARLWFFDVTAFAGSA